MRSPGKISAFRSFLLFSIGVILVNLKLLFNNNYNVLIRMLLLKIT